MSEEIQIEDKSKLQSRKFLVWTTWTVIAALTMIMCVIVLVVTKSFPQTMADLVTLVLNYFFYISIAYISVNGLQKLGFAFSDAIRGSK